MCAQPRSQTLFGAPITRTTQIGTSRGRDAWAQTTPLPSFRPLGARWQTHSDCQQTGPGLNAICNPQFLTQAYKQIAELYDANRTVLRRSTRNSEAGRACFCFATTRTVQRDALEMDKLNTFARLERGRIHDQLAWGFPATPGETARHNCEKSSTTRRNLHIRLHRGLPDHLMMFLCRTTRKHSRFCAREMQQPRRALPPQGSR